MNGIASCGNCSSYEGGVFMAAQERQDCDPSDPQAEKNCIM